jgi:hypothetical protein
MIQLFYLTVFWKYQMEREYTSVTIQYFEASLENLDKNLLEVKSFIH